MKRERKKKTPLYHLHEKPKIEDTLFVLFLKRYTDIQIDRER